MEVTHVSKQVTHAVVGGQEAREFGISNSAEFFNILSNTLYSNKHLAVVREVLCNGWDIHIEAQKTDVPIIITLTKDKLTIKDSGTGIADDDIIIVYGTYGNSTKKLDGRQTGGFGLGSKAPFAYTDLFEVTSCYNGTKSIYSMSKSSGEVAGKPSIQKLVSVPTTETGLSVSFDIKSYDDYRLFRDYINTIARFGEMNVVLNDTPIETVPFSTAKNKFMITEDLNGVSGASNNRVFVRYGNVIYPIEVHNDYSMDHSFCIKFLDKLGGRNSSYYSSSNWKLILLAEPDTISVTPSRESLSMTEHTIKALSGLFSNFKSQVEGQLEAKCLEYAEQCIATAWTAGHHGRLLNSDNMLPSHSKGELAKMPKFVVDIDQATIPYCTANYPTFGGFRQKDIIGRLQKYIDNKHGDIPLIQSFMDQYTRTGNKSGYSWYKDNLIGTLKKEIDLIPELQIEKVVTFSRHDRTWKDDPSSVVARESGYYTHSYRDPQWTQAQKLSPRNMEEYLPFLRNIVVLAYNRQDIDDRLNQHPDIGKYGTENDILSYITPRHDKKTQIARDFFKKLGYTIFDLTIVNPWENANVVAPRMAPVVVKPRKKGLPKLSAILAKSPNKTEYDFAKIRSDDVERIEVPKAVIRLTNNYDSSPIYRWNEKSRRDLAFYFGHEIGVSVNSNQTERFVNLGSVEFEMWFYKKLLEEMKASRAIESYFGTKLSKFGGDLDRRLNGTKGELIKACVDMPHLGQIFGIAYALTDKEKAIIAMYADIRSTYTLRNLPDVEAIQRWIDGIPANKVVKTFAENLDKSILLRYLDVDSIRYAFSSPAVKNIKTREGIIDLLTYAIESN